MQAVPQFMPLGGSTYGAENTQTLWLQLMGLVTGFIGAGYLLRMGAREVSATVARLALRRAEVREQLPQTAQQALPLGVRVTF